MAKASQIRVERELQNQTYLDISSLDIMDISLAVDEFASIGSRL